MRAERAIMAGAVGLCCGCTTVDPGAQESHAVAAGEARAFQTKVEGAPEDCPAGALDTSFGESGGTTRFPVGRGGGRVFALDLADDKIVLAGMAFGALGGSSFRVARLQQDGQRDPTFAGGALTGTQWGTTMNSVSARGVGQQASGKIVAIGDFEGRLVSGGPFMRDIALTRYLPDGSLDSTFGGNGKPLIDLGGDETILAGLLLDDDRILAAGSRDGQLLVARFSQDGALDTSFAGGAGYFTATFGDSSTAAGVAIDREGRIVAAGSASSGGQQDVLVVRLTSDGLLDPSFGDGGHVIAGDPATNERAVAVAVGKNGKVVVAGDAGNADRGFLVARFRANGDPDPSLGASGMVTAAVTDGDNQAEAMAVSASGKILVVGNAFGGSAPGPVAARFTVHGALDPSFGTGGVTSVDFGDSGEVHAVTLAGGKKALIGGGGAVGTGGALVVAQMCL